MPQIKTSLKQLFGLFVQSAQDTNLDVASRQLAARMTVAVAHMQRIESLLTNLVGVGVKLEKKVDDNLSTITAQLTALTGGAPVAPPGEGEGGGEMSEEDQAAEMANRVEAETAAEIAAIRSGKVPPPAPAPTPAPSDNGAPAVTPIRPTGGAA